MMIFIMLSKPKIKPILCIAIMLIGLSVLAQAQQTDVDQAIREINRPLSEEIKEKLKPSLLKPPEIFPPPQPKPDEGPRFSIKKIKLTGIESFSPDHFDAIKKSYEERDVSFAELNNLTKEIAQEYLRHGILATCFIPQQKIQDGIFAIQVVEARMGVLHINEHKYFKQNRINYYWKLRKEEIVKYPTILQSLSLINKNPDREAKAIFHKGTQPKTTDVTLDVKTNFPMHFSYGLDNEGVTSTGKNRMNLGVRHNNFIGLDDTLLSGYLFGKDFNGIYTYHSIPITNFGTTLVYGHSYSKAAPKKEFEASGIHAMARDITVALHQDLFREGQPAGEVHLELDAKDNTTIENSGTTIRDRLRVIRLGFDLLSRKFNQATYLITEISQGINGLGARRLNSFSSREAENVFTKLNVTFQFRHPLLFGLQGNTQIKGQVASTRLTPEEGFYLGGISSVRGYPSGDFLADDALQTNTELLLPAFFIPDSLPMPFSKKSFKDNVTFITFLDYGWGNKRDHLTNEKDTANLMSTGAGLRILILDKAILRLEWGFPIGDATITEGGNSRFHFSIDFEM